MKNSLLDAAQEIVNYVHSHMGESCQCMFCGHHHIHTDETNMQERYEKNVCPFVEFERAVIKAAKHQIKPTGEPLPEFVACPNCTCSRMVESDGIVAHCDCGDAA
jgi:hypothetical protein